MGKRLTGLLVLVLSIIGYRVSNFISICSFGQSVKNHQPGPCKLVKGIEDGSEDIEIVVDGLALISMGCKVMVPRDTAPWKDIKGQLLLFDFNNLDKGALPITIEGENFDADNFSPHGITSWRDNQKGTITVFVINHPPGGDAVEKFIFDTKTKVLTHIQTIEDEYIYFANDVVAMSDSSFYYTNSARSQNLALNALDMMFYLQLGTVGFYDGKKARIVVDGLQNPNGINKSPDLRYIYLSLTGSKRVDTLKVQPDYSLEHVQSYTVDTTPDNINVDAGTRDLWIGACPAPYQMFPKLASEFPKTHSSPSQVIVLSTKNGLITDMKEPFVDDGRLLSYSSVAAVYNNKMFVGSIVGKGLMCEIIAY